MLFSINNECKLKIDNRLLSCKMKNEKKKSKFTKSMKNFQK